MTRKSLLLFVATSIIWGSSFLFIRLAVEHMPPAWVVFGRTCRRPPSGGVAAERSTPREPYR